MRRILGGLVTVAVALAAVVGAIVLLQSRDDAKVGSAEGPGERVEARCPEQRAGIARDARPLSEDQIAQALALGNVVLRYRGARAPAALRELQEELSGPYDAEIAAAGQSVILAAGGERVEGLAWGRRVDARSPEDPELRAFAEAWLGEGAPEPCGP